MFSSRARASSAVVDDDDLTSRALARGIAVIKYCRACAPHAIALTCDLARASLTYASKKGKIREIFFRDIDRVVAGRHTAVFRKRRNDDESTRSLSIVYDDANARTNASPRTLDVVCSSERERDGIVRVVRALVERARERAQRGGVDVERRGAAATDESERANENESERARERTNATTVRMVEASERANANSRKGKANADVVAMEEAGEVFAWGASADLGSVGSARASSGIGFSANANKVVRVDTPSAIDGLEVLDVVEVALGARHGCARTRGGEAYAWGDGKGGKLGNPSGQDAEMPVKIEIDRKVIALACGSAHSVAIVEASAEPVGGGDVAVWGDPNAAPGLLGRPEARSVMWFPSLIAFPSARAMGEIKIVHVSCGPYHTACVADDGSCYTWGEGSFFALGHGERKCETAPRVIETFRRDKRVVLRVACGVWHTAAIVAGVGSGISRVPSTADTGAFDALDGEIFTWGDGETGKLGIAGLDEVGVPTRTTGQLGNPGSEVCDVRCGQHHTLALSAQGDVWLAGCVGKVDNALRTKIFTRMIEFETGSVHAIASGENHALAATRDARVYAWGVGKNGVLGLGKNDRNQAQPQEIAKLRGRTLLSLACGPTSSACIVRPIQMTLKEKMDVSRRLVQSALSPKPAKVANSSKVIERANTSSVDTASSSSYSTRRDSAASARANQGLRSEKLAHRLMSVLSPTLEHVTKISFGSSKAELAPLQLEYEDSRSDDVEIMQLETSAPEPISETPASTAFEAQRELTSADEPSSHVPATDVETRPNLGSSTFDDKRVHVDDEEIEIARRDAAKTKADLVRLLAETKVLELAAARAEEVVRAETAAKRARAEIQKPIEPPKTPPRARPPPVWVEHAAPERPKIPELTRPKSPQRLVAMGESTPLGEPCEWVEEVEDGVFMTLETHGDKTFVKRVRFSKRTFSNKLAAQWWEENQARVLREHDLTIPSA